MSNRPIVVASLALAMALSAGAARVMAVEPPSGAVPSGAVEVPLATVGGVSAGQTRVWTWSTATGASGYSISLDGGATIATSRESSFNILLRAGVFDPRTQPEPTLPESLRANAEANVAIVQFVTQVLPEYVAGLEAMGVTCEAFLGEHAYIVRWNAAKNNGGVGVQGAAARDVRGAIAALPFVRWVGAMHPGYRLEEWAAERLANNTLPAFQRYSILTLRSGPTDKNAVAAKITALGGEIAWIVADGARFEARLTPAQLVEVARMDEVLFIDRWAPPEEYMDNVRLVGGANTVAAVPAPVGGFQGQGVRGEVQDSGLFMTHQDWPGTPQIHGANGASTSHGTSVYGIVFGTGRGNAAMKGMLPFGQGVFSSFSNLPNRRQHISELIRPPVNVVFQTNSWGSCCFTNYTTQAADMDDIIYNNDIVLLQAQANNGNNSSDAIAFAKNIVSVGGIRHANTANRADDTHNGTAGSTGPASDGRIKPDLSFWYDNIGTTSNTGGYTNTFGGTSAATPMTAGHFGLFFQMWHHGIFGNAVNPNGTVFDNRPKSTTSKAMMINTASPYPFTGQTADLRRVRQGFGLSDVARLHSQSKRFFIVNETEVLTNLQRKTYTLSVPPGTPELRATMVYMDRAGTANSTRHRVNDLSLRVTSPSGTVYHGNNGLLDGNVSTPGGNPNIIDTVENVWIPNPAAGVWEVDVFAAEIVQDARAETPGVNDADFALVVSGIACRADFNADGTADFFDYLDFVQAFSNESTAADFNRDGTVDFFDYLDFVAVFAVGC
jgi:hypothetical protein